MAHLELRALEARFQKFINVLQQASPPVTNTCGLKQPFKKEMASPAAVERMNCRQERHVIQKQLMALA